MYQGGPQKEAVRVTVKTAVLQYLFIFLLSDYICRSVKRIFARECDCVGRSLNSLGLIQMRKNIRRFRAINIAFGHMKIREPIIAEHTLPLSFQAPEARPVENISSNSQEPFACLLLGAFIKVSANQKSRPFPANYSFKRLS